MYKSLELSTELKSNIQIPNSNTREIQLMALIAKTMGYKLEDDYISFGYEPRYQICIVKAYKLIEDGDDEKTDLNLRIDLDSSIISIK